MAEQKNRETEPEVKCDNHPDRAARTFTANNAIKVNLCEECTPPWFKNADAAR